MYPNQTEVSASHALLGQSQDKKDKAGGVVNREALGPNGRAKPEVQILPIRLLKMSIFCGTVVSFDKIETI